MYQASTEYDLEESGKSRTFKAKIISGSDIISSEIKTFKYNGGSNGDDNITIGSTVSAYIEVEITNPKINFENKEIQLLAGLQLSSSIEYLPVGKFTVQKPEKDGKNIKITAYDKMSKADGLPYFSNLTYPATTLQMLNEICTKLEISLATTGLESITVPAKLEGYTCREALGYLAALHGKFACINRQGNLEIRWYEDKNYAIGPGRYFTLSTNENNFMVNKIECSVDNSTTLTAGSGYTGISISDPLMTQDRLNTIYNALNGFTFRPGSCKFLGDPRLDPWDIVTVTDLYGNTFKIPCMALTQEYDGGISTTVEAKGKTQEESQNDFKGPTTKAVERTYEELMLVKTLLVNKADIEDLKANYATINSLSALSGKIDTLENTFLTSEHAAITYATITNLDAATGRISNLETNSLTSASAVITDLTSNVGKINTLMFGTASGTSLTTEFSNSVVGLIGNAQIKDAMIDSLNVSKINAGKISTNKFTVGSDSGNLNIVDNTIMIKDSTRTRVQIGKDANADYNMYVWDSAGNLMFDALGLTVKGVTRKIIRDDVIQDDANINAGKLDINSLFTQINGSSNTIKSSKIYVDSTGQTLDIAFTSMRSTTDTLASTVSTQGTSLSTMQGQINNKIWAQDITTSINNLEIGGRNLAEQTNKGAAYWYWGMATGGATTSSIIDNNINCCKMVRDSTESTGWSVIYYQNIARYKYKPNTIYTISFEVYSSVDTLFNVNILSGNGTNGLLQSTIALNNNVTANTWCKVTATVLSKSTLPTATDQVLYLSGMVTATGTSYIFKNLKIEEGNKVTGWTPAPEDVQSQIDTTNTNVTTISSNYSTLNQTVSNLSETVSSNTKTIATKADGITVTNLSTAVSNLQLDLNGYKTTVSDTYTTKTDFNNLQIGGRNFIRNGDFSKGINTNFTFREWRYNGNVYYGSNLAPIFTLGAFTPFMNASGKVNADVGGVLASDDIIIEPNTTYTLSYKEQLFRGKITVEHCIKDSENNYTHIVNTPGNIINIPGETYSNSWESRTGDEPNGWRDISITFTTPSNAVKFIFQIVLQHSFSDAYVFIDNVKLEKGSKATDWTPNPDDVQTQIDAVDSKFANYSTTTQMNSAISQSATSITQSVSATYVTQTNYNTTVNNLNASLSLKVDTANLISSINASADVISLTANRFSLQSTHTTITPTGAITCNNLTANGGTIAGFTINSSGLSASKTKNFGAFTTEDYSVTMSNFVAGTTTPTAADIAKYDLDGDGIITIFDIALVKRIVLGYSSSVATYAINISPDDPRAIVKLTRTGGGYGSTPSAQSTTTIGAGNIATGMLYVDYKLQSGSISTDYMHTTDADIGTATIGTITNTEHGSNSNGEYYKFFDGTLICTKSIIFRSVDCYAEWGSLYESNSTLNLGNYAYPFVSLPNVSVTLGGGTGLSGGFIEQVYNQSASSIGMIWIARPISGTYDFQVIVKAIGRWK